MGVGTEVGFSGLYEVFIIEHCNSTQVFAERLTDCRGTARL